MIDLSLIWRFFAGNVWRTAAIGALLLVGLLSLRLHFAHNATDAAKASAAVALDANQAQAVVIHRLTTELDAANKRVAVWVDSTNKAEADRAKQHAADIARAVILQKRLDAALRDNSDWAATPVPKAVQDALK